jgi:hypothetical protein
MIGDTVIGPVICTNLLIDIAIAYLITFEFAFLGSLLLLKYCIHSLFEFFKCPRFVRVLVPLILAGGYCPRGYVCCPHSRVSLVNVLPACPAGPVGVYPDVLLINEKLFGYLRHHSHSGRARVHAALLLSLGYPLHLVDTRLMLQVFIHLLPCDLVYTQLAPLVYSHICLEILLYTPPSHPLTICFVHNDQVCCE